MENEPPADSLTVRRFMPSDLQMALDWWGHRHAAPLPHAAMPPLGVVVEDTEGPAAMLWCYECYGTPVAILEFLITRPGLSLRQARNTSKEAAAACCEWAGQDVVPPAKYTFFRAHTTRALAREMSRMGAVSTDDGHALHGLAFILP